MSDPQPPESPELPQPTEAEFHELYDSIGHDVSGSARREWLRLLLHGLKDAKDYAEAQLKAEQAAIQVNLAALRDKIRSEYDCRFATDPAVQLHCGTCLKCRHETQIVDITPTCTKPHRGDRVPLPARRKGYTQKVTIDGLNLFIRTGEYPDGTLGEIFLDASKQSSTMRSIFACYAIAISLGLQYGVPLEEYVKAFVNVRFEPSGPVSGHKTIARALSLVDLIFRDLAASYAPGSLPVKDPAAAPIQTE